ncbi:NADP-dependent malic enzyme [Thermovirga sp.]|uniref:NAD(P)-dependent malic enzyme n=1 Tax=Thermovirga sp. TaxID=2699834 RepID=UPI0025EC2608|nr:NADP-dependent malic enzyme [Thermovirga sp.]MBO8153342.1 NADP-dependent malic enzyme [Thermovirga sp.]
MVLDKIKALELHRRAKGKFDIYPTININSEEDLSLAYIPGSVPAALAIKDDVGKSYEYTGRGNRIAVITDGSAVLGLGKVGPDAAMPVMEGKCLIFKIFGDVNAIPLCLDCNDVEAIVHIAATLSPSFGGINIEDISSPRTFMIVRELQNRVDIPILCDDQHGTAVVVLAALWNALEVQGRKIEDLKIVVCGAGAAGISVTELLLAAGAKNITVLNSSGILSESNSNMNHIQQELALKTNPEGIKGGLHEAIEGAHLFIGLSKGNILDPQLIRRMEKDPIIFAMALPEPEIHPEQAYAAGASIVGTGLPEYPNAMPNLHTSPGIMRGLLDVRATFLSTNMLLEASRALANVVDRRRLSPQKITPDVFCDEVSPCVAEAVGQAAIKEGFASLNVPKGQIYNNLWENLYGNKLSRH